MEETTISMKTHKKYYFTPIELTKEKLVGRIEQSLNLNSDEQNIDKKCMGQKKKKQ